MSPKTLALLLVILVALVWWQGHPRAGGTERAPGSAILPGLDVNAIDRIEVASAAATSVVERRDGQWVVPSLFGHPADFQKVADALRGLADLKVGQVVRDAGQYPEEFGLAATSPVFRVALSGASGFHAALELGATKREGAQEGFAGYESGRYLRAAGGTVVLVADPLQSFADASGEWIRKELLNVAPPELDRVTVAVFNAEHVLLIKGSNQYEVEGLKDGEETDPAGAARLVGALQSLSCLTVADPALTDEAAGFGAPDRCTVLARNRMEYTLQLGGAGPEAGSRYLRIDVAYREPAPPTLEQVAKSIPVAAESAGSDTGRVEKVQAEYRERLQAHEAEIAARREERGRLEKRFRGWTYVIPAGTAESLILPRGQLVKAKPPVAPAAVSPQGQDQGPP
ncbi:MAG TPA: DUF4340 domain-containing protein [Kiritimatiellia bacterium]|nr:DUF4340 domain-containing protein [Kiritimatiellia bacterium]